MGKNGFGHEEWNFNTSDLIDGKIYGYTYYNPPQSRTAQSAPYEIFFFTIAPDKKRLLVGAYHQARFLDAEERRQLKARLKDSHYIDRRAEELLALGLSHLQSKDSAVKVLLDDFALNVRVDPKNVKTFSPSRVLQSTDVRGRDLRRINRYTKPLFLERPPEGLSPDTVTPVSGKPGSNEDLLTDTYMRFTPAQRRVIARRHNLLSNRFKAWLTKMGATQIRAESASVDVSCAYLGHTYLFELKTCYNQSTRHALREALGQVLDYSLYPGRFLYERQAIVIDAEPDANDITWFVSLNRIGLRIELFWLKGEDVYSYRVTEHDLAKEANGISPNHRVEWDAP